VSDKAAFEIKPVDQQRLNELLALRWPDQSMIICGEFVRPEDVEGIGAFTEDRLHGMATWRCHGKIMHIVAVNAFTEVRGVGVALVDAMIEHARALGMVFLRATVSNDNVIALRFYQKRGFRMSALHRGVFDIMRHIKPSIPERGLDGIPMRDEIELEYEL
jgi:GNAT superfamily N-acetyltransferase